MRRWAMEMWRCYLPAYGTVLFLVVGGVRNLSAQEVVTIHERAGCPTCRIEVGPPLPLRGNFEGGSILSVAVAISRDGNGLLYVFYDGSRDRVDIFLPDGSFSGDAIGERGDGPGEFRTITEAWVSGDALFVYDPGLARLTEFDLATRAVRRTAPLPGHFETLILEDGKAVLSGPVRTRESAGHPLHIYDSSGTWENSFGLDEAVLRPDLSTFLLREMTLADPASFWAAPKNEYRVERWNTRGQRTQVLLGQRPWFERWSVHHARSRDTPPQPILADLSVDSTGLLWVMLSVAHEHWKEALSTSVDQEGNPMLEPGRPYRVAVVEVIDPATGTLLATRRFPYFNVRFAGPGLLMRSWIDRSYLPRAEIIPISLVGHRRPRQ